MPATSPLDILGSAVAPADLAAGWSFRQIQLRGISLSVDEDAYARVWAALELAKAPATAVSAIPHLIEMLGQDRISGNSSAGKLVAAFTSGEATRDDGRQAENMAAIAEADLACHVAAEDALAAIGPAAVPALTDALQALLVNTRVGAAKALGRIGAKADSALAALQSVARSDTEETVRKAAADAVAQIKPRRWFGF